MRERERETSERGKIEKNKKEKKNYKSFDSNKE